MSARARSPTIPFRWTEGSPSARSPDFGRSLATSRGTGSSITWPWCAAITQRRCTKRSLAIFSGRSPTTSTTRPGRQQNPGTLRAPLAPCRQGSLIAKSPGSERSNAKIFDFNSGGGRSPAKPVSTGLNSLLSREDAGNFANFGQFWPMWPPATRCSNETNRANSLQH
jgi:hypothetical protein